MTGYKIISIDDICDAIGEDGLNSILSGYSCPLDNDIEDFLRHKALAFSRQSLAKTHLVLASYKDVYVLAGYYTLSNKVMFIPDRNRLSVSLKRRLAKFAFYLPETKMTILTAPLIAQIGKNYANGYDKLISGDELLKLACDEVQKVQLSVGGKAAYLECRDIAKLIEFYESNGFRQFAERTDSSGTKLIQMIRYFAG